MLQCKFFCPEDRLCDSGSKWIISVLNRSYWIGTESKYTEHIKVLKMQIYTPTTKNEQIKSFFKFFFSKILLWKVYLFFVRKKCKKNYIHFFFFFTHSVTFNWVTLDESHEESFLFFVSLRCSSGNRVRRCFGPHGHLPFSCLAFSLWKKVIGLKQSVKAVHFTSGL